MVLEEWAALMEAWAAPVVAVPADMVGLEGLDNKKRTKSVFV